MSALCGHRREYIPSNLFQVEQTETQRCYRIAFLTCTHAQITLSHTRKSNFTNHLRAAPQLANWEAQNVYVYVCVLPPRLATRNINALCALYAVATVAPKSRACVCASQPATAISIQLRCCSGGNGGNWQRRARAVHTSDRAFSIALAGRARKTLHLPARNSAGSRVQAAQNV